MALIVGSCRVGVVVARLTCISLGGYEKVTRSIRVRGILIFDRGQKEKCVDVEQTCEPWLRLEKGPCAHFRLADLM